MPRNRERMQDERENTLTRRTWEWIKIRYENKCEENEREEERRMKSQLHAE